MSDAVAGSALRRVAVVLFNLGGPDGPDDVRPFLRNLFSDPAIIAAPGPVRMGLAWFISTTRAKSARANYAKMGGGSPLLPETRKQVAALEDRLNARSGGSEFRAFPAMRYWKPFIADVVRQVQDWGADDVVLMPLYPQFSTTTTGSSLTEWISVAGDMPVRALCCYPTAESFLNAHADVVRRTWDGAGRPERVRLLFSAHGLPEQTIERGDPYQWQIERTAEAVAARLPEIADWVVCYQSRVGPLKWIGPSTEEEIERAGADGVPLLVTPIAFVSEHIETLVELDDEYALLASERGVPAYHRVPALGVAPDYIETLAQGVEDLLARPVGVCGPNGQRICPANFSRCPIM